MNVNSSIDSSSSDGDFMKYTPKKIPKRSKYVDSSGDSSSSDDDSMEYTPKKMPKKSKYVNSWRDSSSSDDDSTEGKPQKNPKRNKPRKANVCVYCDKKFVQISQHLKMVHRNEPEMIKIMEGNLTWQERRKEFSKLVGKANFSYNCEAKAQSREADMILKYGKIDESSDLRRFISCKSCHHMYRTNSATRHKCVEDFRKNLKEGEKCRLVIESRQHWQIISSLSPAVRKLFLSLHPDEIADIIISDPTIIMFAEDRMEGVKLLPHENAAEVLHVEKFTQLRAKLRKAATFLKHFRVVSKQSKMTLREAFNPKNNRFLSQVGMKLSKLYTSPHTLSNLKTLLGHFFTTIDSRISHQKISRWAQYRKKFFYTWNNAIQPRVRVAKRNMSEISTFDVPTGAMMSKFNRFINNNLNELLNKEITTYQEYLELARFAFTRITTFNKRRGQEVARMTVKQFHRRVQGKRNVNVSELKMSKLDREIAKFHEVVTLKGKSSKNEIVYAILPINCVAAIEKLLEARGKFEGLENNDYVFAQLGSNNFHIPGPKTIRNIAIRAKVKPVEAFTAGKLRKYIATDMVWMNADPRLKTLLASQLGHNLSMHDDVYNENMRSSSTKFHKIPVILCTYEAGLTLNKPAEDVTDEDVLNYIKGSSRKDDEKKSLQNNSSSRRSTEDLNRIEELAEIVDDDDDDDGDDANDDNAKNRPWNGHNSEFRKSMFKSSKKIQSSANVLRVHSNDTSSFKTYANPVSLALKKRLHKVTKTSHKLKVQDAGIHTLNADSSSDVDDANPASRSDVDDANPVNMALRNHVPVVNKTSSKSDDINHKSSKNCRSNDDSKPVKSALKKHKLMMKRTLNKPKFQYWSTDMKKILKEVFKPEFRNLMIPVVKRKLLFCQHRIREECSRDVSIGSIKGTVHHERSKLRRADSKPCVGN